MTSGRSNFALAVCLVLTACSGGTRTPGEAPSATTTTVTAADKQAYSGIAAGEVVSFTGTEPFWSGEVSGETLTYSTPDKADGDLVAVDRFAGRNGISFSGELDDKPFVMAVT